MTLTKFILPPAVDPAPYQGRINKAVRACVAVLDAAVAQQPDPVVFREADKRFTLLSDALAQKLRLSEEVTPRHSANAWWLNLSAIGFASTGITTRVLRLKIGELARRTDLARHLVYTNNEWNRDPRANSIVAAAVVATLHTFWAFMSETRVKGEPYRDAWERCLYAIDHADKAHGWFGDLHRDYPVLNTMSAVEGVNAWRLNVCRLSLDSLGYRPAS